MTMRQFTSFGLGLFLAAMGHFAENLQAQETHGRAEVRGITGSATITAPDGKVSVVKTHTVLTPGTTIKTGPKSAVDLFLGKSAGVLRLTENSILTLREFKLMDAGNGVVVEIELDLDQGTLLGRESRITTASSKFDVKIPVGIAGITSGTWRISALGYIVLTEGSLTYVHVPATGDPIPYTMKSPPAVYFSPLEGVKPAPTELAREVNYQLKSKLAK
jgi:hypothetical protein